MVSIMVVVTVQTGSMGRPDSNKGGVFGGIRKLFSFLERVLSQVATEEGRRGVSRIMIATKNVWMLEWLITM